MSLEFLAGYFLGARQAGHASNMAAAAAAFASAPPSSRVEDVDERVDRLAIVIEAIWSLLEASGYSPDDLEARMEELSSQVEQASQPSSMECPDCGAMVPRGGEMCQFCGTEVRPATALGGL